MKRNNFALWFIVMVLIVVGGGSVYYSTDINALLQEQKGNGSAVFSYRPVPVTAYKIQRQNIAVTIGSIGTITASESTEIHAEISGKVDEIGFQEGQFVKEGDVLLEIDSLSIRADLDKAKADLDAANIAVQQNADNAVFHQEQAQAAIENLNARLEKAQIKAPFDGVVGLRNFSIGNIVQVGQVLTNIDAVDPMNIEFSTPEKNFSDIREGQEVAFTVDAYPDLFFKGEIYAIDSRVNVKTRSFEVKAMVANAENKLRSGMYARLQIPVAVHSNAIVAPVEALVVEKTPTEEKQFVYVLNKKRAIKTAVKTGIRQGDLVEITEGLSEDQPIAVTNVTALHNKSKVIIEKQEEAEQPAETEELENTDDIED